jgi:penicillin-binding protein 1C
MRFMPRILIGGMLIALIGVAVLWRVTAEALRPVPHGFDRVAGSIKRIQITDRHGVVLNTTYINDWNLHDTAVIHKIPPFLITAFVMAEDKRFFDHSGQDWAARFSALFENIIAMRGVRGASTITEQVVRMIQPRPRTLWARWLEGWEAERLEQSRSKLDILEFYLNQVPYAANRRGVVQAARHYFDRDLETLSKREMLALAVLVRAPSRMDLFSGNRILLDGAIERLASRMVKAGQLDETALAQVTTGAFDLNRPALPVDARHFLRYVTSRNNRVGTELRTTLDGVLQVRLQALLDQRMKILSVAGVANAAMLVADHASGEILAWVIGGAGDDDVPGHMIDAVTTPRQPGSSMKPFLYGLALEKGWTAATRVDDAPLTEMVGYGLHSYKNYSRTFYGPVTLRDALGNSLNIPAVHAIQFTGSAAYLSLLRRMGFETLSRDPDYYGDGLALGNGEITLLELVQAYGALANRGVYRPFAALNGDAGTQPGERVYSAETASLLGNILSDPDARSLEFGSGSLLNLPVQTAVKTGTSSDYRDSWAVGYNDRYVVGVWMGNLDQSPTMGITGSTGPALVLRGAFDILNRHRETESLWLTPRLKRHVICADNGLVFKDGMTCPRRSDYFIPGTSPDASLPPAATPAQTRTIRLRQPTPGLHMAYDPRLPQDHQAFEFVLQGVVAGDAVDWRIDGGEALRVDGARYLWPLSRGNHSVSAAVWRNGRRIADIDETRFLVK